MDKLGYKFKVDYESSVIPSANRVRCIRSSIFMQCKECPEHGYKDILAKMYDDIREITAKYCGDFECSVLKNTINFGVRIDITSDCAVWNRLENIVNDVINRVFEILNEIDDAIKCMAESKPEDSIIEI